MTVPTYMRRGTFADLLASVPYAGAFCALCLVCILLTASQSLLSADLGRDVQTQVSADRVKFALNANFVKASAICAIGFAVMTLTMNAAPLSIQQCGYSLPASSAVLQVHFALMYLPSLFNPVLVSHVGLRGLIVLGVLASGIGCLLTALTEQTLGLYIVELGLSGIGWNFLFNGGTLLLVETYPASGKTKAQGLNSLLVYSANLLASFLDGVLWLVGREPRLSAIACPRAFCPSVIKNIGGSCSFGIGMRRSSRPEHRVAGDAINPAAKR